MVNKQMYLTDDQVEGIKSLVKDLTEKGINGTLKGDAITNLHEPLAEHRFLKDAYMSVEQAWTTAVISRLISAGYEIKKRPNEG